MRRIFLVLLLIFMPLYILLMGTEINIFNKKFYIKSYEKYEVPKSSGRTLDELDSITEDLFRYLKDTGDEEVLRTNFNEKEIKHMVDVKELVKKGYILKYISLIISIVTILFSIKHKEWEMAKGVFYGIFIWWGLIILLFLLGTLDFDKYFTYFHLLFFDNDLWLLDPNNDLLIQMLPQEFFISIFRRIVLLFLSLLAIIQITVYIWVKKEEDKNGWVNKF